MSKRAGWHKSLLSLLGGLLCLVAGQSCVFDDSATVECESGLRCPAGWTCAAAQDVCIEGGCGDGVPDLSRGETCDDGNILDDDGCSSDCKLENCGDGLMQAGEVCDDGNNVSGDDCSADCLSDETCGNDYVDVGEVCDDGDTMSTGDGCRGDCSGFEMCGNGVVDIGEDCDNRGTDNMSCDSDCTWRVCGDGHVNTAAGEDCDPNRGQGNDAAGCDSDCTDVECGDSHANTEAGEDCDTGGDSLTCDGDCTPAECGDGYANSAAGETCDDDNDVLTDDCPDGPLGTCTAAECGDGFILAGSLELCDDAGDSATCDGDCTPALCGDSYRNSVAGEECDDGDLDTTDECPDGVGATCLNAFCGDGFVRTGMETCDPGLGPDTDSALCDRDCTPVFCGDGLTNIAAGETCDDDDTNENDGCPSGTGRPCKAARCGDGYIWNQDGGDEDCDDGGDSPSCDGDCTTVDCGDTYINTAAGEACDDGNAIDTDACIDCVAARCGDGEVWAGREDCDRGGVDHAMCDRDCTAVNCGDGLTNAAAGEQCDDNNEVDTDACPSGVGTCKTAFCGDGFMRAGVEICDPDRGANTDSADCDRDCTPVECGDGYVNSVAGEDCDTGKADPNADCAVLQTCRPDCTCG